MWLLLVASARTRCTRRSTGFRAADDYVMSISPHAVVGMRRVEVRRALQPLLLLPNRKARLAAEHDAMRCGERARRGRPPPVELLQLAAAAATEAAARVRAALAAARCPLGRQRRRWRWQALSRSKATQGRGPPALSVSVPLRHPPLPVSKALSSCRAPAALRRAAERNARNERRGHTWTIGRARRRRHPRPPPSEPSDHTGRRSRHCEAQTFRRRWRPYKLLHPRRARS
jgi:hypothetical protein